MISFSIKFHYLTFVLTFKGSVNGLSYNFWNMSFNSEWKCAAFKKSFYTFFHDSSTALYKLSPPKLKQSLQYSLDYVTYIHIFYSFLHVCSCICIVLSNVASIIFNFSRPNPGWTEKININFYFHISLRPS